MNKEEKFEEEITMEYVLTDKQIEIIAKLREVRNNLIKNWEILDEYDLAPEIYLDYEGWSIHEWSMSNLIVGHNYNKLSVSIKRGEGYKETDYLHEVYVCDIDGNIELDYKRDIEEYAENEYPYKRRYRMFGHMFGHYISKNDISQYGTMPRITDEKLLKEMHLKDK